MSRNIDLFDFNVLIVKSEDGYGYDYIITQEFEVDGQEEVEVLESGNGGSLYEAAQLAGDAVKRLFVA